MISLVVQRLDRVPLLATFLIVAAVGILTVHIGHGRFLPLARGGGLGDEYDAIATNLLLHGSYSASSNHPDRPTVTRGPTYPIYLAGVFMAFGLGSFQAARFCDVVLHATAALTLAAALRRLISPRAAAGAALLYGLWPSTLYYVAKGSSETMACLWLIASLYAHVRLATAPALKWASALGAFLALACLTRGSAVGFAGVVAVWLLARCTRRQLRLRLLSCVALTWLVFMAPWWIRNYQVTGQFVPFHSLVWYNAYHDDVYDSVHRWLRSENQLTTDWRDVASGGCPSWVLEHPKDFAYPPGLGAREDLAQEARYRDLVVAQVRSPAYLPSKMWRNAVDFWSAATTIMKSRILVGTSSVWLLLFAVGLVRALRSPAARPLACMWAATVVVMWGIHLPLFAIFRHSVVTAPFIAATVALGLAGRSAVGTRRIQPSMRQPRRGGGPNVGYGPRSTASANGCGNGSRS